MNRLEAAIAIIPRRERFFVQRRSPLARLFPGLWEFPGGKVEGGESPLEALHRELEEELGWLPAQVQPLPRFGHRYEDFEVSLFPFCCRGGFSPCTDLAWAWVRPDELLRLPLLDATRRLVSRGLPRR